ncbi:response regulator [Gemmatimonadota bacterium]
MSPENAPHTPPGEILVVEDNTFDLKLLSDILTKYGYQVRPAADGEQALRSVQARLPDLILLDVNMSGMNGVEICRRLKADLEVSDIPVIFISALDESDLKVRALEAGGSDYITKPFEPAEVLTRINIHLEKHRLIRRLARRSEELLAEVEERKRAEEALRISDAQLLNAMVIARLGYWEYDVDADLFTFNDQFYDIFRTTADQVGGYTMSSEEYARRFVHPDDAVQVGEETRKAIETTDPEFSRQLEHRILYADGETGYISVRFFIVKDDHGRTIKTYGANQDITEHRRVEEERDLMEEQYRQGQRIESIGRLAGGVAHDLNNLLAPIIGYSEMLMDDIGVNDARRERVDHILQAGFRARDLVRQLLAFSRKQTLEYRVVDLNPALESFIRLLRSTIREDIGIEFIPSPDTMVILADINQIEQVIMNLAINAQDAMPEGGTLTIETALVDLDEEYAATHQGVEPGEYVMLAVSDTGIGMDEEIQAQIFEPFFSTKGDLGTGLGLATTYGIVKQHRGNIWVYSEPGLGSTFKIYLPLSGTVPVADGIDPESARDLRGSETILLVEDDEPVRTLAHSVLKQQGYTVLVAGSGPEALAILEEQDAPVHLILTDVVMPGMNGKILFTTAAERNPKLKVLFMSGYTDNVIANSGVLDEGVAFIQKPFTIQALATKVREVLDNE